MKVRARPWITQLAVLALVLALSACYPALERERYFHYQLAVVVDGQRHDFTQNISCHPVNEWSEGDGKFHLHWYLNDAGQAAADLGGGRSLIYLPGANCYGGDHQDLTPPQLAPYDDGLNESIEHPLLLLDPADAPTRMQAFVRLLAEPEAEVLDQSAHQLPARPAVLGPDGNSKSILGRLNSGGAVFHRVTAYEIPHDIWATTDEARRYFAQFHHLTLPEKPDGTRAAEFPYSRARRYPKAEPGKSALPLLEYRYDGAAFSAPAAAVAGRRSWYRTTPLAGAPVTTPTPVLIRVGDESIPVAYHQEVFDPERQVILVFNVVERKIP